MFCFVLHRCYLISTLRMRGQARRGEVTGSTFHSRTAAGKGFQPFLRGGPMQRPFLREAGLSQGGSPFQLQLGWAVLQSHLRPFPGTAWRPAGLGCPSRRACPALNGPMCSRPGPEEQAYCLPPSSTATPLGALFLREAPGSDLSDRLMTDLFSYLQRGHDIVPWPLADTGTGW